MRRILRNGAHSEERVPQPADKRHSNGLVHTYTHDTILRIPERPDLDDRVMMKELGRKVIEAIFAGDAYEDDDRQAEIERGLKALTAEYAGGKSTK